MSDAPDAPDAARLLDMALRDIEGVPVEMNNPVKRMAFERVSCLRPAFDALDERVSALQQQIAEAQRERQGYELEADRLTTERIAAEAERDELQADISGMMTERLRAVGEVEHKLVAVRAERDAALGCAEALAGIVEGLKAERDEAVLNLKASAVLDSEMRCMTCGTASHQPNDQCAMHVSAADAWRTEQEHHNAWRKRAMEAEAALTEAQRERDMFKRQLSLQEARTGGWHQACEQAEALAVQQGQALHEAQQAQQVLAQQLERRASGADPLTRALIAERDSLQQQLKAQGQALRAGLTALAEFVNHHPICAKLCHGIALPCTCGLDAALLPAAPGPETP